jgi:hypothetical protein
MTMVTIRCEVGIRSCFRIELKMNQGGLDMKCHQKGPCVEGLVPSWQIQSLRLRLDS